MSLFKKYNLSEEELVKGCISGDRRCQKMLYDKYSAKMYGICLRYCGDTDSAQDALQEGFILVFAKIVDFSFKGSLEGWIKRIIINSSLELLRKKGDNLRIENVSEMEFDVSYEDVFHRFAADDLLEMIAKLPPGCRAVFNMFAIEGYDHKEIASMLSISEGTSKSQLSRARALLKEGILKADKHNKEIYVGAR
jgi:RNA polymerase sigma-70 factor (ECF subfamily)